MNAFAEPVLAWRGSTDPHAPLVALLHSRGSNEAGIIGLVDMSPGCDHVVLRSAVSCRDVDAQLARS